MEWERAKRGKYHKIREHFNSLSCHFTSITSEWSRTRKVSIHFALFVGVSVTVVAQPPSHTAYHLRMNCHCHQHIIFSVSTQNPKRLLFLHKFLSHITVSLSLFMFALFHPANIKNMPFMNAACVYVWLKENKRNRITRIQTKQRERKKCIQFNFNKISNKRMEWKKTPHTHKNNNETERVVGWALRYLFLH